MMERHSIHTALAAVMRSIGGVSKSDWHEHQKFNFRGIDALHNAVYGPLCEHGVFVTPEVLDAHYADVQTSQGKAARQATLRVRYTFHGPAGDSLSVVAQGEAMDSADKATSKALAMAFKYALLQTFVIPTEDQDDGDAHTPERAAVAEPQPAPVNGQQEGVASDKQKGAIRSLLRKVDADRKAKTEAWLEGKGGVDALSKGQASSLIGKLTEAVEEADAEASDAAEAPTAGDW